MDIDVECVYICNEAREREGGQRGSSKCGDFSIFGTCSMSDCFISIFRWGTP